MGEQWKYQLRITLHDDPAKAARQNPDDPGLGQLPEILARHDAVMKSQYDAFAGYVAEAERNGPDGYHLYEWTKAVIENPAKKEKYTKSFTLYVGGAEVYDRQKAEALEAELAQLVGGGVIKTMNKHDTNPANNPQMPARYRK